MSYVDHQDEQFETIHLSAPDLGRAERDAVLAAFDAPWTGTIGTELVAFESALAVRAGTESAVALQSNSAALHLGLRVLGVVRGDTVLLPTLTDVAAANAVRYVGAVPYFVDSEPHTGNIDPSLLSHTIEHLAEADRKPAAVVTADLYGNCADYDRIRDICDQFDVPILEDASMAIGATYRQMPAGSFGDLAVFGFDDEHLVSTGGGGALVGPEPFIERARHLAGQAATADDPAEHAELGYDYRMSNLPAAIGLTQLSRIDSIIDRRRELYERYVDELSDVPGLHLYTQTGFGRGNGSMTILGVNERQHPTPQEIAKALSVVHGIETRPVWKPLHTQRLYAESEVAGGDVAERFHAQGLCLPSGTAMTRQQQDRVVEALRVAIGADLESETVDLGVVDVVDGILAGQNDASSATSEQSGDHVATG